ncbi:DNAJ heat shock N-terminal domain-containing protein [Striga hermonthica]|uniref:DNAJ heat shock N-terminal domain-containing protein n=1 Tax=Striga hermonthica TaxID=68872 RepID=A0A9N7N7Y2_STRHE|nr:DNAJ heat shock N-terminal domain-containing protein [Striga hermonthica]
MDAEVDHYTVLGLPSGKEGAALTDQEINKAYRSKARELHPDKRHNDPNAHANFLKLQTSENKLNRKGQKDSKRRKMMSDLEEKERSVFSLDPTVRAREEEEMIIAQKLKDEINKIRAMHKKTMPDNAKGKEGIDVEGVTLDMEKIVKVSWEKVGNDYTAEGLREIFEEFGGVEDVVIKSSKKKGSALVVATIGNVLGNLSNPLLVLPLQPVVFSGEKNEADGPKSSNLVGAGYQAREDSILEKMRKAAARRQKCDT